MTPASFVHNMVVMEQPGYGAAPGGLDATFAALAHPVRRAILARLALGDVPVNELAEPFSMSQPAISRHLKVLELAGLISAGSDAQRRPRKLEAAPLAEAGAWLAAYREFWDSSFTRLDEVLAQMQAPARAPSRRPSRKK